MKRRATKSAYEQIWSDEWFDFDGEFDLACCSCGHVHSVSARMKDGRLQLRLTDLPRSTAMVRRHHGIQLKKRMP